MLMPDVSFLINTIDMYYVFLDQFSRSYLYTTAEPLEMTVPCA